MIKMEVEQGKTQKETDENQTPANEPEMFLSELAAMSWSVISFDKREAKNLTYEQAEEKIQELLAQKVSGLCIITDEAAERISERIL